jgi:predicted RNA-binding Zn-ribbon protein involved in translation (DUF1610 family)
MPNSIQSDQNEPPVNVYKPTAVPKAMKRGKTVLTCPQCGGTGLYYEAGFTTGYKYHCKDCDYVGSFVIEKDVPLKKKD